MNKPLNKLIKKEKIKTYEIRNEKGEITIESNEYFFNIRLLLMKCK